MFNNLNAHASCQSLQYTKAKMAWVHKKTVGWEVKTKKMCIETLLKEEQYRCDIPDSAIKYSRSSSPLVHLFVSWASRKPSRQGKQHEWDDEDEEEREVLDDERTGVICGEERRGKGWMEYVTISIWWRLKCMYPGSCSTYRRWCAVDPIKCNTLWSQVIKKNMMESWEAI